MTSNKKLILTIFMGSFMVYDANLKAQEVDVTPAKIYDLGMQKFRSAKSCENKDMATSLYKEYAELLSQAAEKGHSAAQYHLGLAYNAGEVFPADQVESAKWFLKAAQQGHVEAQFLLGTCYNEGTGLAENQQEAAKWFLKAAEQGSANAQYNLGILYMNGNGVPKNLTESAKLFRKAADQGLNIAQHNLAMCYTLGDGVPENLTLAYMWANLASSSGYADSAKLKQFLVKEMTKDQIAEAQKMSTEWKPTK